MSAFFSRVMHFAVTAIRRLHEAFVQAWILPVRFYRKYLSGLKPAPCCRFRPTCSAYAIEAVKEWGILVGTILAVCRVFRCNPFCKGGYDPVPKRKDFFDKLKSFFAKLKSREKNDKQ